MITIQRTTKMQEAIENNNNKWWTMTNQRQTTTRIDFSVITCYVVHLVVKDHSTNFWKSKSIQKQYTGGWVKRCRILLLCAAEMSAFIFVLQALVAAAVTGHHFSSTSDGRVAQNAWNLGCYNYLSFADDWGTMCVNRQWNTFLFREMGGYIAL